MVGDVHLDGPVGFDEGAGEADVVGEVVLAVEEDDEEVGVKELGHTGTRIASTDDEDTGAVSGIQVTLSTTHDEGERKRGWVGRKKVEMSLGVREVQSRQRM